MENDSFGFVYKIVVYKDIRTVFLIDVINKSGKNFNRTVKYLLQKEKNNFDLILYVGHLPFRGHGLIKIPRKIAPKQFNFMGNSLKDDDKKELYFSITSWDVNLSNYDLL